MARMGKGRGVHRILVGRPEGKRPLGRSFEIRHTKAAKYVVVVVKHGHTTTCRS